MNLPALRALLLLTLLAAAAAAATGCARRAPGPSTIVRVAVLDGVEGPGGLETRRSVAGWWLGARDRFDEGNAEIHMGDALAREFAKVPGVVVHSRTDVAALMAEKEHLLRRAFPEMTPEERRAVLATQDPVDYGRSLNVDFVVSSRVDEARKVHQRTFHWWRTRASARVDMHDVRTGDLVWSWQGRSENWFLSHVPVLERLGRKARRNAESVGAFRQIPLAEPALQQAGG